MTRSAHTLAWLLPCRRCGTAATRGRCVRRISRLAESGGQSASCCCAHRYWRSHAACTAAAASIIGIAAQCSSTKGLQHAPHHTPHAPLQHDIQDASAHRPLTPPPLYPRTTLSAAATFKPLPPGSRLPGGQSNVLPSTSRFRVPGFVALMAPQTPGLHGATPPMALSLMTAHRM